MRRTAIGIPLLSSLLLSCGASISPTATVGPPPLAGMSAYEGELVVREAPGDGPSLELRFPYENAHSALGWGGMHLWARPHTDHVSVTALVDAPADRARWQTCSSLELQIDHRTQRFDASYVGRPMDGDLGHYDAVQVQLDVLALRKIARARRVVGVACGDRFVITDDQRDSVRRFVEWFDVLAVPGQLRDAPWYREVGPRPELLPLEDDGEEDLEG
ncbi:MAG: hypothetical protein H6719_05095 [Sandaracinaceae bacterium]|nr:hypothetical protein [Sandaracinaceae bacterium]